MSVTHSLATRADWGGLQGGRNDPSRIRDDFEVKPPDARFDRSIRLELRDGDVAPWQSDAEVAQVQAGRHYAHGTERWTEFWIRYAQLGTPGGGWHFVAETHLPSGDTQAPWGLDLTPDSQRIRVWTGPGTWTTVYGGQRPADLGAWHHMRIGHLITTGMNGWYEVWRDDEQIFRHDGRTSAVEADWYPKIGFYRGAGGSGTDVAHIAGWSIHDARPAYPGSAPPPPTPPPPADPCADLRATLAQTVSELNAERERRGDAQRERDDARAGRDAAIESLRREQALHQETISRLSEWTSIERNLHIDLSRIRGNSKSTAGDPWKRLAANVGAVERILGYLPVQASAETEG